MQGLSWLDRGVFFPCFSARGTSVTIGMFLPLKRHHGLESADVGSCSALLISTQSDCLAVQCFGLECKHVIAHLSGNSD